MFYTMVENAEDDVREILSWLEEHRPARVEFVSNALTAKFESLCQFPLIGRTRDDLGANVRMVLVEDYRVYYRPLEDRIQIIRILHVKRDEARVVWEIA